MSIRYASSLRVVGTYPLPIWGEGGRTVTGMTQRHLPLLLLTAVALLMAGCGGDTTPPPPPPPVAAPVTTPTPTPTTVTATYTDPAQMVTKAKNANLPWLHNCDEADYNVYGALSTGCFGRHGETIYFDTFDDPTIGQSIVEAMPRVNPGSKAHVGDGWLVTTEDAGSLRELVAALS